MELKPSRLSTEQRGVRCIPGRWPAVMAVLTGASATGCGAGLGLPAPATSQGEETTWLWQVVTLTAIGVVLLIWGLTTFVVVAAIRRRRHERHDDIPAQHQYRVRLEVVYTVIPIAIVAAILAMTFVVTSRVTATGPADLTVGVIGFQWQWQFDYRDRGLQVSGDPATLPQLWLPVGRNVRFDVSAAEVIHSFWVPDFLDKRDLIPGTTNTIDVTVKSAGQWIGRCAEYCGLNHWRMKFAVCAVDAATFDAWLAEQAAKPQPVVAGVKADHSGPAPGSPVCPAPPATDVGFSEPVATTSPGGEARRDGP